MGRVTTQNPTTTPLAGDTTDARRPDDPAPRWSSYVAIGDSFTEGLWDPYPGEEDHQRGGPTFSPSTSRPGASPPARSRCGTRTSRSGAQAALDPHRAGAGGAGAPAGPGERHRRRQRHPAAERRRRPPRAQPRARGLATARRGDRRAHGDGLRRVAVAARRPDAAARRRVQRPHLVDRAPPGRVRAGPVGHARAARLARVVGGPHPPDPAGHARVAQAALVALGQAPDDAAWDDPLAPLPPAPALDRARQNAQWVRTHVVPWAQRRLRGTSSGDGRLPRRPSCCPSRSPTAERGRLRQRLPRSRARPPIRAATADLAQRAGTMTPPAPWSRGVMVEPPVGFEPTTVRLQGECSTG